MSRKTLIDMISEEELNDIIEMYNNNVSIRNIAIKTNHSRHALSKMLENLNIKITKGNHYRYHTFDYDFFEKIDNEIKAYWLGFMYADGNIVKKSIYGQQSFKLALAERDRKSLEDFKEDLKSTYPIREDRSRYNASGEQVMLIHELRCQKTVDDLKKLGCVEAKSLILTFPTNEQVPEEYIWHFIRGYFDGDGSISTGEGCKDKQATISFTGTESFIKSVYQKFKIGRVYKEKRRDSIWYLTIRGNLKCLKAYDLMYKDSTRYMKRKYNKFQIIRSKYRETEGKYVRL